MNPKRWKWYTWVALVGFAISLAVNFRDQPVAAIFSVFIGGIVWFFLWLLHEIVRAFYLDFTGKMPPPIERPH